MYPDIMYTELIPSLSKRQQKCFLSFFFFRLTTVDHRENKLTFRPLNLMLSIMIIIREIFWKKIQNKTFFWLLHCVFFFVIMSKELTLHLLLFFVQYRLISLGHFPFLSFYALSTLFSSDIFCNQPIYFLTTEIRAEDNNFTLLSS